MPNHLGKSPLHWLWLSLIMVAVDQVTKYWVASSMTLYQSHQLTSFFNLVHVHNLGAAFSFLASQGGSQRWLFTGLALGVCVVLVWCLKSMRHRQRLTACAYALVISGALGNAIDRLVHGYVIDFLDFHAYGYHWPAFNVADCCIFVGAVFLIFDSFRQSNHSTDNPQ